jgi:uncharacterized damage-inducible protein DinB
MQIIQPEQATFLLEVLLTAMKNEHGTTRRVIEAIPADQAEYRPDPNAKSAMELAWHIAVVENRFLDAVASGEFNFASTPRPDEIVTPADVAGWYADNFAENCRRLGEMSGEQLAKVIDFRGMLKMSAVMFLRLGMSHSVHHRGQLSVYLRPMGGKVPAIYGESYDSAQAKKAAQA